MLFLPINHGGYLGSRDIANKSRIIHDGAINVVVDDWNNITTTKGNQNLNSQEFVKPVKQLQILLQASNIQSKILRILSSN
jgi:hypothetical protein